MKTRRIEDARAFLSAVSFCFSLSWRTSPFYTALRLLSNLLPSVIGIVTAWLGKCLLDMLSGAQLGGQREVLLLAAAMLALALLRGGVQKAGVYAQSMHEDMIQGELAAYLMEKAIGMDLEYFDDPDYYDKLTACTRDAYAIENLLWNTLSAVSAGISAFLACVVVCRANLLYGVLMIVAAIPSSIAGARYMKLLYHLSLEQINGERQKGYLQAIATSRSYAQSIRFFHAGARLKEKYQRLWKTMFEARRDMNRRRSILTSLLEFLPEAVAAWVGVDISMQILAGSATVGDYSLYTGLAAQLWSSVSLLLSAVMQIYDNQLKITNLKSIRQFQNHVLDTGTRPLSAVRSIEFDEVCFSYPKTGRKVLDHVSFAIRPGEKVAVVGLNGSGKSTLIKLLLRFYELDSGVIRVNGVDIREYPILELRKHFSAYFQDEQSYSFTLLENLTIADPDHPDCVAAAKQAFSASGCDDLLQRAPKGLDTYLTRIFDENGMELSGGQYQKIALARAFFRRHTALILDEPSSNLDPEAENRLFEELRKLTAGKTVLRKHFSAYFQDEQSYSFTLLENLTIADPDHPDCVAAAKQAFSASGCDDLLQRAPKGLDTYLTRIFDENGMELSGGQYQKIALARAFFRRHTALILDEPSSNLDPEAEHRLFEELRKLTAGKTVLFTSHRLSNVSLADRIVVLEHGVVLEDGTREALLQQRGRFAELFQYQKEHFETQAEKGEEALS